MKEELEEFVNELDGTDEGMARAKRNLAIYYLRLSMLQDS